MGELRAVTMIAEDDGWAVGDVWRDGYHSLAEHWNGQKWTRTYTPPASGYAEEFLGVSASSTNDVWAVGYAEDSQFGRVTALVEHWNGSRWTKIAFPPRGCATDGELTAVAAVAPDDVWVFGGHDRIYHFNGVRWKPVKKVRGEDVSRLSLWGATAVGADDVWAVGSNGSDGANVILHFDGRHWSSVKHPTGRHFIDFLWAVAGSGPDDVWAVGGYSDGRPQPSVTQILHWDGRHWSHVTAPNPGHVLNNLYAVSADSPDDAWAVGYLDNDGEHYHRLCLHWDGRHWRRAKL